MENLNLSLAEQCRELQYKAEKPLHSVKIKIGGKIYTGNIAGFKLAYPVIHVNVFEDITMNPKFEITWGGALGALRGNIING